MKWYPRRLAYRWMCRKSIRRKARPDVADPTVLVGPEFLARGFWPWGPREPRLRINGRWLSERIRKRALDRVRGLTRRNNHYRGTSTYRRFIKRVRITAMFPDRRIPF